jgi:two-component system, LytTR family, response regulator
MTLRTILADDEAIALRRMRRLLAGDREFEIVAECVNGADALEAIRREAPDLVLLDVQMPELDGFEVIEQLLDVHLPTVIFVTAFDEYAMRAFDVHAIDYLLKPFSASRFQLALARAGERIRMRQADTGLLRLVSSLREKSRYVSRLSVRTGGRIVLVDLRTVDWLEAADNYVRIHCGEREYLIRETLASLERQLDPETFVRIHRSTLVRIDRIRELQPATHGDMDVVLRDGTRLTLSRTWRGRARQLFGA